MNILYIHGLDSAPNTEKLELIEAKGHLTIAPQLDYRKDQTVYRQLKKLAADGGIEFIVGSSMGGYFGYWLGQELGIPQLLFNPAMPFRSVQVKQFDLEENEELPSWVAIGAHDEVIPPSLNKEFFKQRPWARVITCQWLEHRIDLQTFEEMLRWAGL